MSKKAKERNKYIFQNKIREPLKIYFPYLSYMVDMFEFIREEKERIFEVGKDEEMLKMSKRVESLEEKIEKFEEFKDSILQTIEKKIDEKIKKLEVELTKKIENMVMSELNNAGDDKVIIVYEMPYDEAKKKVIEYFKEHKEATIVDLHHDLGIDIEKLIEILDELSKEGIIG